MELLPVILLFLVGLVLIIKGGDVFVDAASWIAEVSGIPKFIIGATIVSLATTLPELMVSMIASSEGKTGMAVGNAVGSVTANLGLIMGISLVCIPAVIRQREFAFKGLMMAGAVLFLFLCSLRGSLGLLPSLVLLALFVLFIGENVVTARRSLSGEGAGERQPLTRKGILLNLAKFLLGSAGIVVGARLLVDNGSEIARFFQVPESIIGVTVIAIGTSLPELVTTVTAVVKKQSSLSIGNIIGANLINLTLVMPLCAFVSGGALPVGEQSLYLDLPVCLGVCLLAVLPALASRKLRRWQGVALLAVYAAYLAVLCVFMI